jgi:hypothetical protein
MPIITLQRRLVQQGTIRIGAQVATAGGKMRPSALDKFRFTSDRKDLLDRMAVMYGGTVRPFEEPKSTDTWELFSDADVIEVLVPPPGPGRSVVSQWYEKWSAGGCTHRCDGAVMLKCDGRDMPPDTPCQCDERGIDVTDDAHCDAHTRLSVVIPGTGAIGVWRLNSNGWNAAEEMAGIAAVILDRATSLGYSVPCTLSIQRREVKKLEDGKATTKKFVVPVLSPDVPEDVMRGIAGGMPYNPLAHTSGDPRDVRDALGAPAPAALPSGGVRADRYGTGRIKAQPVDVAVPATGMPLPGGPLKANPKAGFAFINGLPEAFHGDGGQPLRHALYALAAGRDGADFADLSGPQRAQVAKWASMVEAGTAQLVQNAGAYEILGSDADAVVVARHQGGLEKAP